MTNLFRCAKLTDIKTNSKEIAFQFFLGVNRVDRNRKACEEGTNLQAFLFPCRRHRNSLHQLLSGTEEACKLQSMTVKRNPENVKPCKGFSKGGSKMRKVSFFCLLSVLSLLLVVSPSFAATPHFPLYPPPPILDLPVADIESGVQFGYSLAVKDLNGDGYADVVVGVPFYKEGTVTNQGRVYVFDGSGGCIIKVLTYPGTARAVKFGFSVAIGHFTGGVKPDIIVGAPFDNGSESTPNAREGKVYVFTGDSGYTTVITIDKPGLGQDDASFGFAVAAGPTDTAGADELIVGAPFEEVYDLSANRYTSRGKAYHFKWNSGTSTADPTELDPGVFQTDMWYGYAVAMGDMLHHGTGQKDPIVGAPGFNVVVGPTTFTQVGRVYFWDLSGGPTATAIDKPVLPPPFVAVEAGSQYGSAIVAGDVGTIVGGLGLTNDGFDELIVGAPLEDLVLTQYTDLGTVYVQDNTGTLKYAMISPNFSYGGGHFGASLALGDIDGDGVLDIIVGAPHDEVVLPGPVFVEGSGQVYAFTSDFSYNPDSSLLTLATATRYSGVGSSTELLFESIALPGDNNAICGVAELCGNVIGYHNHESLAAFGWAVGSGNINDAPFDDIVASGTFLNLGSVQDVGRVYLLFEDAQPEKPTGLNPPLPSPVDSKTVILATDGIFKDKDVATCTESTPIWTDLHQRTEWRISNTSTNDCATNGPGKVLDIQTCPSGCPDGTDLYKTPSIDLTTLSAGPQHAGNFNFGDTIYWCVRYKDNVDGGSWTWSEWSVATFTIGIPDLQVISAVDILAEVLGDENDSPYPNPGISNTATGPLPPHAPHRSRVSYQTVSCKDCRTVDITVKNTGTATAHITAISLPWAGWGNGSFTINSTPTLPFDVIPNGTYVVQVTACGGFPVGNSGNVIRTTYDDPINYYMQQRITSATPVGHVVPGSAPVYPIPPPYDHDFGDVIIGSPAQCFDVLVEETGNLVPLKVTAVVLTELFSSPLSPLYTWTWKDADDQEDWIANGFVYVPKGTGNGKKITVCFDPKAGSGCALRLANLDVTHNGDGACNSVIDRTTFAANVVGPDLEGRWTSFSSSNGHQTVRGVLRITNIGTKDLVTTQIDLTKNYFRVSFYLSSDANLDTSDTLLYSQDVYYLLRAGETKYIGFNWDSTTGPVNGQYILAVIDSEQNFVECIDFIGPIPPLPPSTDNPAPIPAYYPFSPGNVFPPYINNIAVPAKPVLGAFPIP